MLWRDSGEKTGQALHSQALWSSEEGRQIRSKINQQLEVLRVKRATEKKKRRRKELRATEGGADFRSESKVSKQQPAGKSRLLLVVVNSVTAVHPHTPIHTFPLAAWVLPGERGVTTRT